MTQLKSLIVILQRFTHMFLAGFDQDWDEESSGITCEHSLSHPDFLGKVCEVSLSGLDFLGKVCEHSLSGLDLLEKVCEHRLSHLD